MSLSLILGVFYILSGFKFFWRWVDICDTELWVSIGFFQIHSESYRIVYQNWIAGNINNLHNQLCNFLSFLPNNILLIDSNYCIYYIYVTRGVQIGFMQVNFCLIVIKDYMHIIHWLETRSNHMLFNTNGMKLNALAHRIVSSPLSLEFTWR